MFVDLSIKIAVSTIQIFLSECLVGCFDHWGFCFSKPIQGFIMKLLFGLTTISITGVRVNLSYWSAFFFLQPTGRHIFFAVIRRPVKLLTSASNRPDN
jgi:hypothetical protein